MSKKCLHVKVDGVMTKYTAVVCVCIFKDYLYDKENPINEPVLYFQQRRKTKHGETCRERAIPLSKVEYMSY